MKKIALALASVLVVLLPASADAAPKHHHEAPSSFSRAIDWD